MKYLVLSGYQYIQPLFLSITCTRARTHADTDTHTHTHNVTCAPLRLISPQHWRASKEVLIVSTLKQVLVLCQHVAFYNVTTLALEGYKALLIHKPWSQASCFVCLFEEDLKRCCKSKSRSFAPLSGQLSFIELWCNMHICTFTNMKGVYSYSIIWLNNAWFNQEHICWMHEPF